MNAQEFVRAIKIAVQTSAANGLLQALNSPPGRPPSSALVKLSQWFKELPEPDQENVRAIVRMTSEANTYNFLAVLDGLIAIEPVGVKGKLELFYHKDHGRVLLNDPSSKDLTARFKDSDHVD